MDNLLYRAIDSFANHGVERFPSARVVDCFDDIALLSDDLQVVQDYRSHGLYHAAFSKCNMLLRDSQVAPIALTLFQELFEIANRFIYMVGYISIGESFGYKISVHISKAYLLSAHLRHLWHCGDSGFFLELRAYKATFLSMLLCGCGTWSVEEDLR